MQRAGGDLVAPQALHPDTFRLQEAARHFDEAQAAPFARGVGQLEAARLEAVQKCGLDGGAAGFGLICPPMRIWGRVSIAASLPLRHQ